MCRLTALVVSQFPSYFEALQTLQDWTSGTAREIAFISYFLIFAIKHVKCGDAGDRHFADKSFQSRMQETVRLCICYFPLSRSAWCLLG